MPKNFIHAILYCLKQMHDPWDNIQISEVNFLRWPIDGDLADLICESLLHLLLSQIMIMKQKIAELDDQESDKKTYEAGCELLLRWYKGERNK